MWENPLVIVVILLKNATMFMRKKSHIGVVDLRFTSSTGGRALLNNGYFIWRLHKKSRGNPYYTIGCLCRTNIFWTDKLMLCPGRQPI